MKTSLKVFWFGLLIYAASFFLVGVQSPGSEHTSGPIRGYNCAWIALAGPIVQIDAWSKGVLPILMPLSLLSGLINPIFIATVVAILMKRRRPFQILRITVLVLFPFCWVTFFFGFPPREGYFLWTIGMLLVLFSTLSGRSTTSSSSFMSAVVD